jgi:hypothetical protein
LAQVITHPVFVAAVSLGAIGSAVGLLAWCLGKFSWLLLGVRLTMGNSSKMAILIIGAISMVCLIIMSEGRIEFPQIPVTVFDSFAFELLGYGFSLSGFGVFVFNVFLGVHEKMRQYAQKLGEHVLEVV